MNLSRKNYTNVKGKNVLYHDLRAMELHVAYDIELNITP